MNKNDNGKPEYAATGTPPERVKSFADVKDQCKIGALEDSRKLHGKARYLRRVGRPRLLTRY